MIRRKDRGGRQEDGEANAKTKRTGWRGRLSTPTIKSPRRTRTDMGTGKYLPQVSKRRPATSRVPFSLKTCQKARVKLGEMFTDEISPNGSTRQKILPNRN